MAVKHGNLSINSENIFPIIKKWLYSDHDIFVRELVSNGCDAITKLKKLEVMGEYTFPEGKRLAVHPLAKPAIQKGIATNDAVTIDGNFYTAQDEHAIPQLIPCLLEVLQ